MSAVRFFGRDVASGFCPLFYPFSGMLASVVLQVAMKARVQ